MRLPAVSRARGRRDEFRLQPGPIRFRRGASRRKADGFDRMGVAVTLRIRRGRRRTPRSSCKERGAQLFR